MTSTVRAAARTRGVRKGLRSLLQGIAGGGFTALVTLIAGGLPPFWQAVCMAVFTAVAAFLQNYFETAGQIPAILPTPPLVSGEVVGEVTNATGEVVGEVAGTVGGVVEDVGDVVSDLATDLSGGLPILGAEEPQPKKRSRKKEA